MTNGGRMVHVNVTARLSNLEVHEVAGIGLLIDDDGVSFDEPTWRQVRHFVGQELKALGSYVESRATGRIEVGDDGLVLVFDPPTGCSVALSLPALPLQTELDEDESVG